MANAAVEFLLKNIKQLLLHHPQFIGDAKSQLEKLENDLNLFKSFLKDSNKNWRKDDSLWELVRLIHDVVHEAEDVIDAVVTLAAESKSQNYFLRASLTPAKLSTIAKEIETVANKVRDIHGKQRMIDFAGLTVGDGDPEESEATVHVRLYS